MEVEADAGADSAIDVRVRDYGGGLQPNTVPPQERSLGLGLPLIAALARRYEIRGLENGGLEVHMVFTEPSGPDAEVLRAERLSATEAEVAARAAGLSIVPGPLVSAISSRVTAMLAARADFPLDRLADAVLVSDAIAAHAETYVAGGDVGLAIEDGQGSLDFRVGPLRKGGARGLLAELEVPGFGGSLERLVDRVEDGEESGSGQGRGRVSDPRRSAAANETSERAQARASDRACAGSPEAGNRANDFGPWVWFLWCSEACRTGLPQR